MLEINGEYFALHLWQVSQVLKGILIPNSGKINSYFLILLSKFPSFNMIDEKKKKRKREECIVNCNIIFYYI